jgi:AhpD family alkylhydroperoxidase
MHSHGATPTTTHAPGEKTMKPRLDYARNAPGIYDAMDALTRYLDHCGLDPKLVWLVQLRASQLNGCAFCLDMHWKDLRAAGENEQRLYSLDAWRECPYYSERERAALAWAEAVTQVADGQVPDAVFAEVKPHFTDKELCDLTCALSTINAWNRLSIAARIPPGTYQAAAAPAPAAADSAPATPAPATPAPAAPAPATPAPAATA